MHCAWVYFHNEHQLFEQVRKGHGFYVYTLLVKQTRRATNIFIWQQKCSCHTGESFWWNISAREEREEHLELQPGPINFISLNTQRRVCGKSTCVLFKKWNNALSRGSDKFATAAMINTKCIGHASSAAQRNNHLEGCASALWNKLRQIHRKGARFYYYYIHWCFRCVGLNCSKWFGCGSGRWPIACHQTRDRRCKSTGILRAHYERWCCANASRLIDSHQSL